MLPGPAQILSCHVTAAHHCSGKQGVGKRAAARTCITLKSCACVCSPSRYTHTHTWKSCVHRHTTTTAHLQFLITCHTDTAVPFLTHCAATIGRLGSRVRDRGHFFEAVCVAVRAPVCEAMLLALPAHITLSQVLLLLLPAQGVKHLCS